LFCYEPPLLPALLAHWARQETPIRLLVASGRATLAVQAALVLLQASGLDLSPNAAGCSSKTLSISYLPPISQTEFDRLLWCCDLNFVRGEDSLARALWAGKPLVWQIYPQDDGAHHAKLEAFLSALSAPPALARFHHLWNANSVRHDAIHALPDFPQALGVWGTAVQALRSKLLQMDDLASQLVRFVQKKR
jgi:uncharacterized repeat protein (TIGR03837 family)